MRPAGPRRDELGPERDNQQYRQRGYPVDDQIKELERGGVVPMGVLERRLPAKPSRGAAVLRKTSENGGLGRHDEVGSGSLREVVSTRSAKPVRRGIGLYGPVLARRSAGCGAAATARRCCRRLTPPEPAQSGPRGQRPLIPMAKRDFREIQAARLERPSAPGCSSTRCPAAARHWGRRGYRSSRRFPPGNRNSRK